MNKTIIITGANGNLGKATVERFLKDGYSIVVTIAPGETFDHYAANPNVDMHYVDLLDESEAETFVTKVIQKYGSIHAALLLVGGYSPGSIHDTNGVAIKKMYSLNFETAYFIARPVFNQMVSQSGGKIVLVGARPALVAADGKNSLPYALSKSLIFKLAEFLNAEGSAHNVVTSVIVPSIIDTPPNRKSMPSADFSAWVKPAEIADTIAFIISENTSALRDPVFKVYGRS